MVTCSLHDAFDWIVLMKFSFNFLWRRFYHVVSFLEAKKPFFIATINCRSTKLHWTGTVQHCYGLARSCTSFSQHDIFYNVRHFSFQKRQAEYSYQKIQHQSFESKSVPYVTPYSEKVYSLWWKLLFFKIFKRASRLNYSTSKTEKCK